MDQNNDSVNQDTSNTGQEAETGQDTQSSSQEFTPREKQLFERAKRAEAELKKNKELPAAPPVFTAQPSTSAPHSDDIDVVLDLRTQGYSDKEIKDLRGLAKKYNKPLSDLIADPFIKSGIEAQREKAQAEQATPAPTHRSQGPSAEERSKMSPDEKNQKLGFNSWRSKKKGGRG